MNISNISGTSNISSTQAVGEQQAAQRPSSLPPPPTGAATSKISPRGELMAKLSDLAQKDPAKLKQVLTDIATKLKDDASQSPDNPALAKLADRFAQAAQSGDISSLAPPQQQGPGGAHGHHHHGGGGGHHGGGGALEAALSSALSQVDGALSGTGATTASAPVAADSSTAT